MCINVMTAFLCNEDKLPFLNAELHDKVNRLLTRVQNSLDNSAVVPSHPRAEPFFSWFYAQRNSVSTNVTQIVGVTGIKTPTT